MPAALADDILNGAYWAQAPSDGAELAIAYCGAMAPEASEAFEILREDVPDAGLLAVTSPDVLHRDWLAASRSPWTGEAGRRSHIERLLEAMPAGSGLVTLIDGAPSTLSWLGSVKGQRVRALGTERFGQTGDLPDTYAEHRLDANAILDAAASLLA